MAVITFYEKPGCKNNTLQKKILKDAGYILHERDLLSENWTPERLRPFFASKQVSEWFNPSAPRIKSGEVMPEHMHADQALAMMVADPLLIRRPLMVTESHYLCGFDPDEVTAMLTRITRKLGDVESCQQADGYSCKVADTV